MLRVRGTNLQQIAAAVLISTIGSAAISSATAQSPEILREIVNDNAVTLLSGELDGTYLYIASDIASIVDQGDAMRVIPVVGRGGAQNVRDLIYLRGIDLAIVRSDALSAFARDQRYPDLAWQLRYVARLHNEEFHLLSSSSVASVAELNGKRVNIGLAGSGTQLTARTVFHRLGIEPIEFNLGQAEAFEQLQAGNIDATVLVAGKPAASWRAAEIDRKRFRFLNIPWPEMLRADYRPAEITHDDYPNLLSPGERIDTIAASAVLAAYNWPQDSDRYRRIARFVGAFLDQSGNLGDALHHPKWREFDVAVPLAGFTRFAAADDWLDRNGIALSTQDDLKSAFARFLNENVRVSGPLSTTQRELLFKQFTIWRRANHAQPVTATAETVAPR